MSYPVRVAPIEIDSTQGNTVILKSGLQAGQQVVTDGQEKLQAGSRVVPHASTDLSAARQAKASGNPSGQDGANPNPGSGGFSNGRGSDRDAGAGKHADGSTPKGRADKKAGSGSQNSGGTASGHPRRNGN